MNICHINFSFTIGGVENMIIDLVNEQSRLERVTLIVVNRAYCQDLLDRISTRVKVILLNRPPGNKSPIHIIRLWNSIRTVYPDVIHCHSHNLIQILQPFRKRCLYTVHQLNIPLGNLKKYKMLFAISKAVQNDLICRANIGSILIYNGIPFSSFKRRTLYRIQARRTFKIVQISRLLQEEKGQDLLIESMKELTHTENRYDIHLDIIGDGPSKEQINTLIKKHQLANVVTVMGAVDRNWLFENLHEYHLLVQPSRTEGFGLTAIEGIAANLPIIASNIGGLAEILKDIPSATFFKPEDPHDLALQIKAVLNNYVRGRISSLCTEALIKIKHSPFDIKTTATEYLKNYCQIQS